MQFKTLRVRNLRSLEDFSFDFKRGVTGVMGPNYTGKSNFSSVALDFSLTGNTGDILKRQMLTWGESVGYTELEFAHGGKEWVLKRNLHNAHVSLTDGEETWANAREVDAILEELIGMPLGIASEMCFVRQFQLSSILEMTKSARTEWFMKISGVDRARKLREQIQHVVNRLPVYPDRTSEIADIKVKLEQSRGEYREAAKKGKVAEAALQEYLDAGFPDKALQELSLPSQEEIQGKLEEALKRKASLVHSRSILQDKAQANPVEKPEGLTPEEKDWLSWVDSYKDEYDGLLKEQAEGDPVERYKGANQEPVVPEDPVKLKEEAIKVLAGLEAIERQATKIEKGECPECGRPYEGDYLAKATALRKEVADRRAKGASLEQKYTEAYSDREKALKEAERYRIGLQKVVSAKEALAGRIQELSKRKPSVEFDVVLLRDRLSKLDLYTRYLSSMELVSRELSEFDSKLSKADAEISSLRETRCISSAAHRELSNKLSKYRELVEEINSGKVLLATLAERGKGMVETLSRFEEEQQARAKRDACVEFLQKAREILHRDKLPRVTVERRRRLLNGFIHEYLQEVDCGFQARLDTEFTFMVDFENGMSDRPVADLSGGQKVILSVAFHLAKARLAPIPVMVLDEPSFYLNRAIISQVAQLFGKVSREFGERITMLVPTHEVELSTCFNRVFDMETQEYK